MMVTVRRTGLITTVATLLLTLNAGAGHAEPSMLGYYADDTSMPALKAEASILATAAVDLYDVDIDGNVTGTLPAAVRSVATPHHISLLAVVSNYGTSDFDPAIAIAILTPGPAQDHAIDGMVRVSEGLAGIDLDFEAVPPKERPHYTAFVARLAHALHVAKRVLMLSVPAVTRDDPTDSWAGAYDYPALGKNADTLQVMTYDENGPWGPPGPVSGLDWMTQCLAYAQSVLPPGKVNLGFPAYGYDWNLTTGSGVTVSWTEAAARLAKTGATPKWDDATSSPWFRYKAADGSAHEVWYENARSITLKAELAAQKQAAGISVWALGLDSPSLWRAILASFKHS